jgi:acyl-CoA thioesterase
MTEPTLERMITIFDVEPLDPAPARFRGDSDGGGRRVVDGSQILAQSLVAASKALPGRTVRSAHALFVSFHDPVRWDGWIRYHHESTYVGAGMSYVRGQVLTEEGRLVASFTQDAMIRAFEPRGSATSVPVESRL